MRAMKLTLCGICGFVILASVAFLNQKDPTPEEYARMERAAAINAEAKKTRDLGVKEAVKNGIVRKVSCTGNEAQVPLSTWLTYDADNKRALTTLLAQWCEDQQSGNRMTIIDSQSGRTLATFDGSSYSVR